MKSLLPLFLFLITCNLVFAQSYIHAHNDYLQPQPLLDAVEHHVYSLEVDLFLVNGKLLVAHSKKELEGAPQFKSMYLKPILKLYKKHKGRISTDSAYAPVLMLDIKENGSAVLPAIIKALKNHRKVFDRSVNPMAMQIVISGDRGAISQWTTYPAYIFFDGRPYENYDSATLQRVGFISDTYKNYADPTDSTSFKLQMVSEQVHKQNKLIRIWGMPDNAISWQHQKEFGIDIINTDKVAESSDFFKRRSNSKLKN